MQPNSRALKVQAHAAMWDSTPSFWLVTLVFSLLVTILPALIYEIFDASLYTLIFDTISSATSPNASLTDNTLIGLFVTLLVTLVSVIVQFGHSLWALRCWRREEENGITSLFEGFALVGRILFSTVLVTLNIVGWSILLITACSVVFTPILTLTASAADYILVGFYSISIMIASIFIYLRYSLVVYVLIDHPELSVFQVVSLSVSLTRSRLWILFRLQLSFFWWYLFSFLVSAGVPLLIVHLTTGQLIPNLSDPWTLLTLASAPLPYWIGLLADVAVALFLTPYLAVTVAGFYDNLIQPPQPDTNTYNDNIY